jgi:hypothetical protein
MASSSRSLPLPFQRENLFDYLYNCLLKKDLPAIQEVLKVGSFTILDKTNRTIVNKLAANNQHAAIQFMQAHFDISLQYLIAGYAEAGNTIVADIIARELNPAMKFELICFATHGYARANSPKLEEYYKLASATATTPEDKFRAKMLKVTGLLYGKHIDPAFEFIYAHSVDAEEQFKLLEEAVLATALLGIHKKVVGTIDLYAQDPDTQYDLQRKAMLGFSQGNHHNFIVTLRDSISSDSERKKLIRVAAFGFAKGNHFDKAKAVLDNIAEENERCRILESIVAGCGKGGLRGKALAVLDFAKSAAERQITLLKLTELYKYELVTILKEVILPLSQNESEEKVIFEILFMLYKAYNNFGAAIELLQIATAANKLIFSVLMFDHCIEKQLIDDANQFLFFIPVEQRGNFLKKLFSLYVAQQLIEPARSIYMSLPQHEQTSLHDTQLINELSRKGAFRLICEIFKNQNNFIAWSGLYLQLDKAQLFESPGFATPDVAIVTLAHVEGDLQRRIFANDVESTKQNAAFIAMVLLAKATRLNNLFRQNIISTDEEGLAWLKLTAAQADELQFAWDTKIVTTFKAARAWFRLPPDARVLLLQFSWFPKKASTEHLWFKIMAFLTPLPAEPVRKDLFRDLSFYSYKRLFFAPMPTVQTLREHKAEPSMQYRPGR